MQLYLKCESAGKFWRKFLCRFPGQQLPGKQSIHNLVSKLRKTGSLLDKKPDEKLIVLTDDKLDAIHVRLEGLPKNSQTTSSVRRATLLNLLPYMTAVVRVLVKHHLFLRIHSGSTKKEYLLRDFYNFWNKRLP
jgi:hypothetical protein